MTRSANAREPSPTGFSSLGSAMNNDATTSNTSVNNYSTTGTTTESVSVSGFGSGSGPDPGVITYPALLTPAPSPTAVEPPDAFRLFRYFREEMLWIFHQSGGKCPLGLQVER
jgi:hypothetical protein